MANVDAWSGALWIAEGWALFAGTPGDNTPHAHHAVQLCAAPEGALRIGLRGGRASRVAGGVVASEIVHRIEDVHGSAVLLFLDPESRDGRRAGATRTLRSLDAAPRRRLREALARATSPRAGWSDAEALRSAVLACLLPARAAAGAVREPDPRVARALREIAERTPSGAVRIADLACAVGLSAGRLSHLFRRDTGLAVRAYVRWTRVLWAVRAAAGGASLTEAALAAGFADAAHLSRTFRRSFGVPPSGASGRLRVRVAPR